MPHETAADAYDLELKGRRGNSLRLALNLLFGVVTFEEFDFTRYRIVLLDRDDGELVATLNAGRDHHACAGLIEIMREQAHHSTPQAFRARYEFRERRRRTRATRASDGTAGRTGHAGT